VERLEQLAGRLAQGFLLEAVVARTHVLEDRLLGAGSNDRLALPLDEDVGALTRSRPCSIGVRPRIRSERQYLP